jgi:hypothetical protein
MNPTERIAIIRKSLTIFICGLFGLVPVIGIIPGIFSMVGWVRIRRHSEDINPAARYAKWGVWLSLLGIFISLLAVVFAGMSVISQHYGSDYNSGYYGAE